jgi:hypothetical protein
MKATGHRPEFVERNAVVISGHARSRMFERNISTDELLEIVANGEVIEEYPDREPCPAVLILGFINHTAYHVVVAFCQDNLVIITAYLPEEEDWVNYRKRKDVC